ncbi:MAG: hypothetical protein AAGF95_34870, partial [Chloroflexota bacterium]
GGVDGLVATVVAGHADGVPVHCACSARPRPCRNTRSRLARRPTAMSPGGIEMLVGCCRARSEPSPSAVSHHRVIALLHSISSVRRDHQVTVHIWSN